jgi:N6-adenosine-specific RNA methylase IME4
VEQSSHEIYGRLKEGVHFAGYSFERACAHLEWLLEADRWKLGQFDDVNKFLDSVKLDEFRIVADQRKRLAKRIKELQPEASQRTIAKVIGVDESTVRADLGGAGNPAPHSEKDNVFNARETSSAGNPAPRGEREILEAAKLIRVDKIEQKRAIKIAETDKLRERNAGLPESERRYSVIYADPPWSFEVWSDEGKDRSAENHYPTMTQSEIEAMPVAKLAADHCALFCWAVMHQLPEALAAIRAWGFEFKTCAFVWIKLTKDEENFATGMGYWTRANAEVCLLATRGSPPRLNADVHQVIQSVRGEHSRKPDEAAARIMRLVPGPYIELFARRAREGWDIWGNAIVEAESASDIAGEFDPASPNQMGQTI